MSLTLNSPAPEGDVGSMINNNDYKTILQTHFNRALSLTRKRILLTKVGSSFSLNFHIMRCVMAGTKYTNEDVKRGPSALQPDGSTKPFVNMSFFVMSFF